jgi:hypothetical protein
LHRNVEDCMEETRVNKTVGQVPPDLAPLVWIKDEVGAVKDRAIETNPAHGTIGKD